MPGIESEDWLLVSGYNFRFPRVARTDARGRTRQVGTASGTLLRPVDHQDKPGHCHDIPTRQRIRRETLIRFIKYGNAYKTENTPPKTAITVVDQSPSGSRVVFTTKASRKLVGKLSRFASTTSLTLWRCAVLVSPRLAARTRLNYHSNWIWDHLGFSSLVLTTDVSCRIAPSMPLQHEEALIG